MAGVDQRGGGPGTREIALLNPVNHVEKVHAILLSGGSAFGLDAAAGVMKYLEESNIGYQTGVARVPIVPAAILFDLNIGDPASPPGWRNGLPGMPQCLHEDPPEEGSVGAGTGASVGKLLGMGQATKAGMAPPALKLAEASSWGLLSQSTQLEM